MTPDEIALLADAGRSLLRHMLVDGMEGTVLWGIHATLSIAAIACLSRRTSQKSARYLLLGLSAILILSTTIIVCVWTQLGVAIRYGFIEDSQLPFEERWANGAQKTSRLQPPLVWISNLVYLIPDVVLIWRLWVIWTGKKIFMAIPLALFIVALALSCTSSALTIASPLESYSIHNPVVITNISYLVLSLVVNAIATAMFGYDAYQHRKLLKRTIGNAGSGAWVVLLYMTESGAVYCVMQLITLVLTVEFLQTEYYTVMDYASSCWSMIALYTSISYPAIVVLAVAYNRSLANTIQPTHETHVEFAAGRASSTTAGYSTATVSRFDEIGVNISKEGKTESV